jgi:tetratricopeptide (TPR) repeat protein
MNVQVVSASPIVLLAALLISPLCESADRIAPLIDGMGTHHHRVTTSSPLAQRYFDQGMVLSFGFNHKEAARSFRQAQALDPTCAMCFWGEALVLGPNINAAMDPVDNPRAFESAQRAMELRNDATVPEQAYIEALSKRYAKEPPDDRRALDLAYAQAMGEVARHFPDDPDAGSLYAEALMDTTPWDYWEPDNSPKPVTRTILSALESVLAAHPSHPLANHLYIHTVEKVHPELGVAAADRLGGLVPGAGHLVHMPGHIYIRVGRYNDAVLANEKAIAADDAYIAQCHAQGLYPVAYVPHNHHFLAAAASFIGDSGKALSASRHMQAHQDQKLMRQPGYATLQHYWAMPYFVLARFGHWDEIMAEPKPASDLIYPTGIWHYARGLAQVRKGDLEGADQALATLASIADDPEMAATRIWETNTMADILSIAREVLAGEVALARGQADAAIGHFEAAVRVEDALTYVEPSDWYTPARHNLGAALLKAGRAAEAEVVYRRDLEIYPANGWSLAGLEQSLRAQHKGAEAENVRRQFEQAWSAADITIASSRL